MSRKQIKFPFWRLIKNCLKYRNKYQQYIDKRIHAWVIAEDYDLLHLGLLKTVLPKPLGRCTNDNIDGNEHAKKTIG